MDVQITYETLFDLLRKERSLEELQSLDAAFWSYVVNYVNDRQAFFDRTNVMEQEKARIQIQNIKRILKEIYERREKKIVGLALNVIRTDNASFVDKRNMLPSEKELFDEFMLLLTKYKQGVLLQVFQGHTPLIAPVEIPAPKAEETADLENVSSSYETENSKKDIDNSSSSVKEKDEDVPEMKVGSMIVRFKSNVPKFLGKNKKVFGPYDEGKIVQLPAKIAQILIKKGKVEPVMA